jgi:hypothetical protein
MKPLRASARCFVTLITVLACSTALAGSSAVDRNPLQMSPERLHALELNQIFHGTFSSDISDGAYEGKLDTNHPLYVPVRNAVGSLFVVPKKDAFDSVRISIAVSRHGALVGTVLGGIIYWRADRCIIAFGDIQKPDGQFAGARGYFSVTALDTEPVIKGPLRPGMTVFVPGHAGGTIPIQIDHTLNPPSDEADDD